MESILQMKTGLSTCLLVFLTRIILLSPHLKLAQCSLEAVTERLLHEERNKLERNSDGRVNGAMHARRYRRGGPRCYNCQKQLSVEAAQKW